MVTHVLFNQELTEQLIGAKDKLRETTDKYEEQLQNIGVDHQKQLIAKEQIIRRMTETLEEKESMIKVSGELLGCLLLLCI